MPEQSVAVVEVYDACGDPITVTPGVLDADAEWVYRNGQCLALAVAVAEATGWPVHLRTFTEGDGYHGNQPIRYRNLRHAYAQAPDGTLYDVSGAHDPVIVEEDCRTFDGENYLPPRIVPADQARGLLAEFAGYLVDQDLATATTFVPIVLAHHDTP